MSLNKREKRQRRKRSIKKKLYGTAEIPRASVFKSNKHIYVQFINDEKAETMATASDFDLTKTKKKGNPTEVAMEVGKKAGKNAEKSGIKQAVFDRGGFKYHGRVKALADGIREAGIKM